MARPGGRLLRETRAARRPLAVAGLLGVAGALLVVAQAVLLAQIVDGAFMDDQTLGELTPQLAALAAVVVVRGLVAGGFEAAGRLGALGVMGELRERVARRLLVARPTGLPGGRSGELATAMVQGVEALEGWFARYLPQVVLSAIVPVAVLAWVLPHDPAAGLVLAISVPLVVVFMVLVGLRAREHTRRRERALTLLGAHFLDVVRGLRTLRAHDREAAQQRTLADVGERLRRETMATLRVAFLSALVLELLAMLGTALVAATVGIQLAGGHLELEVGLAVLLLAPELFAPLRAMGQQHHAGEDGLAAAERILAVLDAPASVAVPEHPRAAPDPSRTAVRLEDVTFAHDGRGTPVLRGATLEIAPGESVSLVAPSGAGKSTLAALVLRLADPDAGRVICGGIDLREVDADAWRERVAWVPQRAALLATTLRENVRLGAPDAGDRAVREALESAGLGALLARLPDGLDTRLGDGGRALSAGEARRVALARAIVRDAPLLVLDEPTAHLDPAAAAGARDAIVAATCGRSALVVTHDLELAARCDRVVALVEGRLVAEAHAGAVAA